jgi:peptide/nickel transport system permease protein
VHRVLVRRLGALAATVLVATMLGHIYLTAAVGEESVGGAIAGTPSFLFDALARGELGQTPGGGCNLSDGSPPNKFNTPLCASYPAAPVAAMLRERLPIDISLLLGGLTFGTLLGVLGGRWCATRPRSRRTKGLHLATALQLSMPAFLQALIVLFYFSSNASEFVRLPFLSGAGDYVPFSQDPLMYAKAMWAPWLLAALPLAAFVLRITEASLRDDLHEDFVRTARAKGLPERTVVNRHALPVAAPAIAAMTGVNVATLLINVAVIEYAFSIPGMFRVLTAAVLGQDVPVLQALVLEGVILIVIANFLADAVQARLDPRVAN